MSSNLIPPMPNGTVPGSGYWNDWIEKLRTLVNSVSTGLSWSVITGKPTTISGYGITDPLEYTTHKDSASGYAGLNGVSRVTKGTITTDDLIVDNAPKGLVLKDTQATPHYWRVTVSTLGALVITDLGTTAP